MKLNKTLAMMRECNNEGGALTIYGDKAFNKICKFKAITSCENNNNILTFTLKDGSEITAYYSEIIY